MIDTTSINWGINKLQSAFISLQPKIEGLTQQYIQYKVTEQIITSFLLFFVSMILLFISIVIIKKNTEKSSELISNPEKFFYAAFPFAGFFGTFIGFLINIPPAILAIKYPIIFTIQSMITK